MPVARDFGFSEAALKGQEPPGEAADVFLGGLRVDHSG